MPKHMLEDDGVLEWRRLTDTLWVGLGPDGVVGCIEIGRRCLVTNGEGRVFGRFRRFSDAQAMLALLRSAHADGLAGDARPRAEARAA